MTLILVSILENCHTKLFLSTSWVYFPNSWFHISWCFKVISIHKLCIFSRLLLRYFLELGSHFHEISWEHETHVDYINIIIISSSSIIFIFICQIGKMYVLKLTLYLSRLIKVFLEARITLSWDIVRAWDACGIHLQAQDCLRLPIPYHPPAYSCNTYGEMWFAESEKYIVD